MILNDLNSHVVKSLSLISLGAILGAAFTFLSNVLFARHLDLFEFGILASSLVAINLSASFSGFGVGLFWLNIFGIEGIQAKRWIKPSLKLICVFMCLMIFFVSQISVISNNSLTQFVLILIPWFLALVLNDLAAASLQLQYKFNTLSLWLLLPHLNKLFVAVYIGAYGLGLESVGHGIALVSFIMILLSLRQLFIFFKNDPSLEVKSGDYTDPSISDAMKKSWPFAASGVFYFIYFQTNILILYWLIGSEAAGLFYAGFIVVNAIYVIPSSVFQKYLLPLQHRWASDNPTKLLAIFRFTSGVLVLLGIFSAIALIFLSFTSIFIIFGDKFIEANKVVFILAVGVPFKFLAIGIGGLLSVKDLILDKIKCMGFIAFLNVVLNLILIQKFSFYGAAIATLITDICLLFLYLYVIQNRLFGSDTWLGWTISIKSIKHL